MENNSTSPEQEETPEPITVSDADTAAPEEAPPKPPPVMETHAHHLHKAPGNKFWHYFFEFFMLFLAVFCGFLTENLREHKLENDRAKELAKSFYQELMSDSATAVLKVNNRLRQENSLQYLMKYYKDSSLTHVSKTFAINFEYGINFRTPSVFEPKTIILEQLKNSGSLRYFKNEELQKLVGDLTVAIGNIYDRQDLEGKVRMEYLNPILINQHDYDFWIALTKDSKIVFDKALRDYEKSDTIIPFQLKSVEKIDRQQIVNTLGFYCYNAINSTRQFHIQRYIDLNAELLRVLREEYHID